MKLFEKNATIKEKYRKLQAQNSNWEFIVTSDVKQNKREIEGVERKRKGIFIRKWVLPET